MVLIVEKQLRVLVSKLVHRDARHKLNTDNTLLTGTGLVPVIAREVTEVNRSILLIKVLTNGVGGLSSLNIGMLITNIEVAHLTRNRAFLRELDIQMYVWIAILVELLNTGTLSRSIKLSKEGNNLSYRKRVRLRISKEPTHCT